MRGHKQMSISLPTYNPDKALVDWLNDIGKVIMQQDSHYSQEVEITANDDCHLFITHPVAYLHVKFNIFDFLEDNNAVYESITLELSKLKLNVTFKDNVIVSKYSPKTHPVIAIDLDDTIWPFIVDGKHIYPNPGTPFKAAIKAINRMIVEGYEVIIWTARSNSEQATACKKALLDAGINPNFKWNWYSNNSTSQFIQNKESSRKIDASIFFDDKAWGAPVYSEETWTKIFEEFFPNEVF